MVLGVLAMARNSRPTCGRQPASRQVILNRVLEPGYVLAVRCFPEQSVAPDKTHVRQFVLH